MEQSSNAFEKAKILYFSPRKTLYEVLGSVKIKHPEKSTWHDGLVYRELGTCGQVYCRPLEKFDDEWEVYES